MSSVSLTSSSVAGFRPPGVHQVQVTGFFGDWIETLASSTVHVLLDRCIQAGMLDQIDPARPSPGLRIPFQGGNNTVSTQMFWDSDFGKSIEAASYTLAHHPDPALEIRIDEIVDAYARLQAEDGYLNSWYLRIEPGKRWTNLRDCHELYNAGHLMEGAVAYFHATGKRRFLDVMTRYADYLCTVFGMGEGQMRGYCGHPEVELALVKLGRATGKQDYIDLARFFIDQRGQAPHYYDAEAVQRGDDPKDYYFGSYEYSQSHEPVRDQRRVVGHAVRAAYLYAGMADVATEFADHSLSPALNALWDHLTKKNLYITGGFGPSAHNEGLTFDYDLPNATAYAETCAAVALVFWASRMLGLGPNRRYADIMERALYNGALVGLSRDGTRFFYDNPLESRGVHHRWQWHHCPCCPPNIARLIGSIGTYAYGMAEEGIAVHLYIAGEATLALPGGAVRIRQETRYPQDGKVIITLQLERPQDFTLSLRLPGWSPEVGLSLNGEPVALSGQVTDGYVQIRRPWQDGDRLELELAMPVQQLHAAPEVGANQGRVALMRGPLVYCLEEQDNGSALNSIRLDRGNAFRCEPVDAVGGMMVLTAPAVRERAVSDGDLYTTPDSRIESTTIRAIPYYAWDNRAPGEMLVWLRQTSG